MPGSRCENQLVLRAFDAEAGIDAPSQAMGAQALSRLVANRHNARKIGTPAPCLFRVACAVETNSALVAVFVYIDTVFWDVLFRH
jgi:hypothetical protein